MSNRIKLEDATLEQIQAFATLFMGIEHDNRATIASLTAKIRAAGFEAEDIPDMTSTEQTVSLDKNNQIRVFEKDGRKFTKIIIPESDDPLKPKRVPISVNGVAMLIDRGVIAEIPLEYAEVLLHAVETRYEPSADGKGIGRKKEVQSYPFSFVA